ncbi:hypothetical protein FBR02_14400 [Anaerolineae bacterium CFX9]|nr:hypothetical protein [Anaerolineae bacterium CFX9]
MPALYSGNWDVQDYRSTFMAIITHCGLFFTQQDILVAQQNLTSPPFSVAWQMLRERQPAGVESAQMAGFRYRFQDDSAAAEAGISVLVRALSEPPQADRALLEQIGETLMLTQTIEMLRDHPLLADQLETVFAQLSARIEALAGDPRNDTFTEALWVAALRMCAGVVMEQEPWIEEGVSVFRHVIEHDVRPQGFITQAVEGGDGGGMFRQILSVTALVLMAEAALHAGIDLWRYAVRGVTVSTAAMYPIYYFYTTEKWKWDADLQPDEVQMMFRRYGGWLEMLYKQTRHKDVRTVLDDLRPVYSAHAGGLTTLTHGVLEKKRGIFG